MPVLACLEESRVLLYMDAKAVWKQKICSKTPKIISEQMGKKLVKVTGTHAKAISITEYFREQAIKIPA